VSQRITKSTALESFRFCFDYQFDSISPVALLLFMNESCVCLLLRTKLEKERER